MFRLNNCMVCKDTVIVLMSPNLTGLFRKGNSHQLESMLSYSNGMVPNMWLDANDKY